MDPLTFLTGTVLPLITGRLADAKQLAEAQTTAIRLIRIELRINASIIDHVLPDPKSKPKTRLPDVVAIETVKHISTETSCALLGGIGVPSVVITGLDKATQKLIRADKLPGQIKSLKKGSSASLIDLLDYLVRKDREMKALSTMAPIVGKSTKPVGWLTRLRHFKTVSINAADALSMI